MRYIVCFKIILRFCESQFFHKIVTEINYRLRISYANRFHLNYISDYIFRFHKHLMFLDICKKILYFYRKYFYRILYSSLCFISLRK